MGSNCPASKAGVETWTQTRIESEGNYFLLTDQGLRKSLRWLIQQLNNVMTDQRIFSTSLLHFLIKF